MRFAFYGRVSTDDAQDPSLSIPRSSLPARARSSLPAATWSPTIGRRIGPQGTRPGQRRRPRRLRPARRPLGDLLEAAANGRVFDTVIVESGVAEWYVRDLIEKSRRGMEESARQGWHTGGPVPYGYRLEEHPHPNPHKAREGKKKHRLLPDPVQTPIVAMIFEDYCLHGMGLDQICDKLNRDLERYPPPKRNRKDEMALSQTWSRSQVQAMLRNSRPPLPKNSSSCSRPST